MGKKDNFDTEPKIKINKQKNKTVAACSGETTFLIDKIYQTGSPLASDILTSSAGDFWQVGQLHQQLAQ